jgi:tetratricopeptide (TPR) repeat protein
MAHWRRAEEAADQAIAHYERINDLRGWGDSVNVQLYTLYYMGRFNECLDLGQELYQTAVRNENVQHQAWGLWMPAKSLIRLGRFDEAAGLLEQAQAANELEIIHISGSLALAYWDQGLAQKALETIRRVDISAGEASPGFATLSANANVAETYLLAWEAAQMETTGGSLLDPALLPEIKAGARQACKVLRGFSRIFPIGRPAAWLFQGKLDWLEGKTDKAYKAWQKSIDFAEKLAMPYELARAHYEIGRHLPRENPQRQRHLQLASEEFERLGAAADLKRAQQEQQSI